MKFSKGWLVTLAGTGMNLALGVLYAWSVIAKSLVKDWGWTATAASKPYAVACGVFALMMVFAGRAQDKYGPRIVAGIGGALTGLGLLVSGMATQNDSLLIILGFGVLAGTGIGLGYASATPPAIKWFPSSKKGLITGIVVSGFGLASVYISPLTKYLLTSVGINNTFFTLGGAFFLVTAIFSTFLINPPASFKPESENNQSATSLLSKQQHNDYQWYEMVKMPQFYFIWMMFACASFAGLMIIGHMAKISGTLLPGTDLGFILVALLAIGNSAGRIIAGMLSDTLGRLKTMFVVFVFQAVIMLLLNQANTVFLLSFATILIGFNYGANLSLFPAITADYFGSKNLGVNYGLVFTSWGTGGVFGSIVAGLIADQTGSYNLAFMLAAALCFVAAGLTALVKSPQLYIMDSQNQSVSNM